MRLLRESAPYWTMGLFLTFYVWIDSAMLALMAPSAVVGWYGVATRLFGTMLFVATIVSTAWLPRLVRSHQQGDDTQMCTVARRPFDQLLVLSFPIGCGAAVVAGPLMRGLFGGEFEGAVPVMTLLALCVVPLYINVMANQVLIASGRQMVWTWVMLAASVVNPLLNLALINVFQARSGNGAIGAALSLLVTEIGIAGFSALVILRGVVTGHGLGRALRSLIAALAMTALVWFAAPIGLIGQVAAGVAVFAALAMLLRIPTLEERSQARALAARVRQRMWP
jgi:O-antigen/teichoic acid export membrane protein